MRPILFYSEHLKFFFGEVSYLVVYDTSRLAHSRKFLYSIYRHRPLAFPKKFPPVFYLQSNRVKLILSLGTTYLALPVRQIHAIHDVKNDVFRFEIDTRYYEQIYKTVEKVTKQYMYFRDGKVMIVPSTGAIVFYERNEKSEEVVDVAIGLLSIYSPDEIIQKYM